MLSHMTEKPAETVTVEFAVGMGDGQYKASVAVPAGRTNREKDPHSNSRFGYSRIADYSP